MSARQLQLPDQWRVVRAAFEGDDLDTVFRIRLALPAPKDRKRFPTMLILKWPYKAKKDGMPHDADLKRMSAFEDALEKAVEAPRLGHPVACLTGNGRRTWRYYVDDVAPLLAAVRPVLAAHGPEPHLFREVDDPAWEAQAELLSLLDCEDG